MKTVYVLLSRSDTLCARMIRLATAAKFNHVSICLDEDLGRFYSFARRRMHNPLIAGFIAENLRSGILGRNGYQPCLLFALDIPDEAHTHLQAVVDAFFAEYHRYRYNFIGVPLCYLGIPFERRHHYLCSQYVAFMLRLTGSCTLPRPVSLMKPMHITQIPELRLVYSGPLSGVSADAIGLLHAAV